MNLHQIAVGAIRAVNPMLTGTIFVSTGYTTTDSFERVPAYREVVGVSMQVQSLTYKDIQQLEGLNLQGTRRAIYVNGRVEGLVRTENRGGDLIVLPTSLFTATITGTLLTVESLKLGMPAIGDKVIGVGVAADTFIVDYGDAPLTYELSVTQTVDTAVEMTSNQQWLVAMALETWPDWCKLAVTLQNWGQGT